MSTNAFVSLFAVKILELRAHMMREANGAKVASNTLMLLTSLTEVGTASPRSHALADPKTREQVNVSETLKRRVQSLAMKPISAELTGAVACHEILNILLELRSKETASGGTSV
jgi:hypothetical protein